MNHTERVVIFRSASDEFWYDAVQSGLAWELFMWFAGSVVFGVVLYTIYVQIKNKVRRRRRRW
jgi:hypothetical protein